MTDQRQRMLTDAAIAGFIGYGVVIAFFAGYNVLHGRSPFYTAALLGEALFAGLRDPAATTLDPGMVLAFNGVHLLAFLLFGVFGAWLVYETELHPEFWYLAFFFFLGATVMSYAAVLALTVIAGSLLSPWMVVSSSLLGALAMAGYLAGTHRGLVRAIRGADDARLGRVE